MQNVMHVLATANGVLQVNCGESVSLETAPVKTQTPQCES